MYPGRLQQASAVGVRPEGCGEGVGRASVAVSAGVKTSKGVRLADGEGTAGELVATGIGEKVAATGCRVENPLDEQAAIPRQIIRLDARSVIALPVFSIGQECTRKLKIRKPHPR
jgi:hypothetical protein